VRERGKKLIFSPIVVAELLYADTELFLEPLAIGDIHEHAGHPCRPAAVVNFCDAPSGDPADRAISLLDAIVRDVRLTRFNGVSEGLDNPLPIIRVDRL
jgi:hypothetical protein